MHFMHLWAGTSLAVVKHKLQADGTRVQCAVVVKSKKPRRMCNSKNNKRGQQVEPNGLATAIGVCIEDLDKGR